VQSHHVIGWLIIGLIAGALAGRLVEGRGLGCLADLVVGVAGAVIGGAILDQVEPHAQYGLLGSIVVAFIGACILLAVLRLLSGGRHLGGGRPGQDLR
jgi:uncharacterized membrane protein YeaQ/YmgE (transglycosylase-associated protein family)